MRKPAICSLYQALQDVFPQRDDAKVALCLGQGCSTPTPDASYIVLLLHMHEL
jgi:hypothetical protein